jgi:hypothetical protein
MEAYLNVPLPRLPDLVQNPYNSAQTQLVVQLRAVSEPNSAKTRQHAGATAASGRLLVLPVKHRPQREETGLKMSVTIANKYLFLLQQIVSTTSEGNEGKAASTLHSEAIPGSESIRVWLSSGRSTMDKLMSAIMWGLPSGEFGKIMPA